MEAKIKKEVELTCRNFSIPTSDPIDAQAAARLAHEIAKALEDLRGPGVGVEVDREKSTSRHLEIRWSLPCEHLSFGPLK